MSTELAASASQRRSLRVLRSVHELHKLGYQRVRIAPGMAPSGMHWRCFITHAGNILDTHGAMLASQSADAARYSSSQENEYFGWTDAKRDTAAQLADKLIQRFSWISGPGRGRDWLYAGWYVEMLGLAERGAFPIAYADWYEDPEPGRLPTTGGQKVRLPMPPGGEASPDPTGRRG